MLLSSSLSDIFNFLMQILVSWELLPIQISSQGFLGKRVSQTYWATDPICESAFSQTLILPRINFSAQPAWQRYTKRKINKIGCFTIKKKNWQCQSGGIRVGLVLTAHDLVVTF